MASNLGLYLTGGEANTDPNASLGGIMSITEVGTDLFDNITSGEAVTGITEYRAIDIYNVGDAIAGEIKLWLSAGTFSDDTEIEIALDPTTQEVESVTTAPEGMTFSKPSQGAPITLANMNPLDTQRVWIKRICSPDATNILNDGTSLLVQYA